MSQHDDQLVSVGSVTAALSPLLDRIAAVEQSVSTVAGLSLFSRYPLAEVVDTVTYLAGVLAEQPARPNEPRMVADLREQVERGER